MKWLSVVFRLALVFCFVPLTVLAQDDDLEGFDIEELDEEETDVPYFAVAAGFTANWLFPNLDDVNASLAGILPGSEFSSPVFMTGWQGFLGVGVVDNVRIGFVHMSGSLLEEGQVTLTEQNNETVNRRFEYGLSFDGITIDYAFTPIPKLAVLPGVMIGWGSQTLEASQSITGDRIFGREFDFDNDDQLNLYRHLEATHIVLQANLNVELAVTRFAMIRVNAGYLYALDVGAWKADKIVDVGETDDLEIKPDGLTVQAGVFVGLFY